MIFENIKRNIKSIIFFSLIIYMLYKNVEKQQNVSKKRKIIFNINNIEEKIMIK